MAKKKTNKTSSKNKPTTKVEKKVEEKVEEKVKTENVVKEEKKEKTQNVVEETKTTKEIKKVNKKEENKKVEKSFMDFVKENSYLIVLCVICLLLIINIVLVVIGHKAKLKDGNEIIASIEGKEYTSEELFDNLKKNSGATTLINLIDEFIVNKEIKDDTEAKKYAEEQVNTIKSQYESYGYDWNDTLTSYGYNNENELVTEIMNSYKKELVVKNYLKEKVTDDEINKYYDEEIFGDYTAKHILITPDTNDDMSDEEKQQAEETAKNKAQEVINRLNNGEAWANLVNEYSQDEGSKDNEGLIENFTKGDVADEFFNSVLTLNDNEYTKEPVKSSYGYHIILKISNTEKDKLDDIKSDIIDKIVENKLAEDESLYNSTWVSIRNDYKLEINDTQIQNDYKKQIEG